MKSGPKPLPRKKFNCIDCNIIFTVPYINDQSNKIIKRCKKCDYNFKKSQRFFDDKVNYDELYIKIKNFIKKHKTAPTYISILKKLKISTKTYRKCMKLNNSNFSKILDEFNLKPKGRSKFQHSTYLILSRYFKDLIQEYKVGVKYIDFYIPSLNLAIECDGGQHYDEDNYFNKKNRETGRQTSMESDKIKEQYCKDNNIKLIRIPYEKNVTLKYLRKFISLKRIQPRGID